MYVEKEVKTSPAQLPAWLTGLIPLLAMGLMLLLFTAVNPLALFNSNLPPIENLSIDRIRVVEDGFEVSVLNSGPHPVHIAQVMVDDAYWQFNLEPSGELPRFGRASFTSLTNGFMPNRTASCWSPIPGSPLKVKCRWQHSPLGLGCENLPAMDCWAFMLG